MKRLIGFFLGIVVTSSCVGQKNDSTSNLGDNREIIEWTEKLSWNEVKAKARAENKYIFIDCYTTWCGPCKRMDEQVYINSEVGKLMNQKFFSYKLQMDKTSDDGDYIKASYVDAALIQKEFKVISFPTLLFLSPDGKIVKKEVGFRNVADFIIAAKDALQPGKKYIESYPVYDQLVAEYRKGNKDYIEMPHMIREAKTLGESSLVDSLIADYFYYLANLKEEKLYTRGNIEFIASNIRDSKQRIYSIFYPDGKKVNKIMGDRGYAQAVVDRVVSMEITTPFLGKVKSSPITSWENDLKCILRRTYSSRIAKFALLSAKIKWLDYQSRNRQGSPFLKDYLKHFVEQVKKYGINRANISITSAPNAPPHTARDITLNGVAWDIFIHSTEKRQLNAAIRWMGGVVERSKSYNPGWEMATKDTYANLLYKVKKTAQAIQLEREVWELASKMTDEDATREFRKVLEKMISGQPTWE